MSEAIVTCPECGFENVLTLPAAHPDSRVAGAERLADSAEALPILHIEVDEPDDEHAVSYVVDEHGKAVGRLAAPQTRQPAEPKYGADGLGLPAMMRPRAAAEGSEPLDDTRSPMGVRLAQLVLDAWNRTDDPEGLLARLDEILAAAYASQTSEDRRTNEQQMRDGDRKPWPAPQTQLDVERLARFARYVEAMNPTSGNLTFDMRVRLQAMAREALESKPKIPKGMYITEDHW